MNENIQRGFDYTEWLKGWTNRAEGFETLTTIIGDFIIETSDCRPPVVTILGVGYNENGVYDYIGLTEEAVNLMKEDREYIFMSCIMSYDDYVKWLIYSEQDREFDCPALEIEGAQYKTAHEATIGHERICNFIKSHGWDKFEDDDEDFVREIIEGEQDGKL